MKSYISLLHPFPSRQLSSEGWSSSSPSPSPCPRHLWAFSPGLCWAAWCPYLLAFAANLQKRNKIHSEISHSHGQESYFKKKGKKMEPKYWWCSSPWIFLCSFSTSEFRSLAFLWVLSASVTALSASAALSCTWMHTKHLHTHLTAFLCMDLLFRNARYLFFKSVYIIWKIVRVLVQLVDSGLLVVDGRGELIDQTLQRQKRKCVVRMQKKGKYK